MGLVSTNAFVVMVYLNTALMALLTRRAKKGIKELKNNMDKCVNDYDKNVYSTIN